MRVVAIVQVRFGSSRLPGKAVRPMHGRPMMLHALDRAAAAAFDAVWLATTTKERDDEVASIAKQAGYDVHRGDEVDVIRRMHETAILANADVIVRVTGDCPLWAPDVGRKVLEAHLEQNSNGITTNDTNCSGYPDGLDVEVFPRDLLKLANDNATSSDDREHVTRWIRRYCQHSVVWNDEDWKVFKLSVDDLEDFRFVGNVMANVPDGRLAWHDTREAVRKVANLKVKSRTI